MGRAPLERPAEAAASQMPRMPRMPRVVRAFVFESPDWIFVAVVAAIALVKTGVGPMPNNGLIRGIVDDPFVNPIADPEAHYLFWNWLGPFLAWSIGATTIQRFDFFYLAFSVAFTALFVRHALRILGNDEARAAIVFFFALPASSTAYFWVGMDSLTLFLLLVAIVNAGRPLVVALVGIAVGMQHFEQGLFATGVVALYLVADRALRAESPLPLSRPIAFCVAFASGVVVGKMVLYAIFSGHHITVNSGRPHRFANEVFDLLREFATGTQIIVWSVLGVAWLVAARCALDGRRAAPFFIALGGASLILPLVNDETRVIAIVTFPLLAFRWLFDASFLRSFSRDEVCFLFLLWIAVPWIWVWRGEAYASRFPEDVVRALHAVGRLIGS